MNSLFEVIDLSKEYQLETYSVLILLSDLEQEKLFTLFPELKRRFDKVMSYKDWGEYLKVNKLSYKNDGKFYKRAISESTRLHVNVENSYESNEIATLFDNKNLKTQITIALQKLTPTQRKRFLQHYVERLTYRDIAKKENRSISTIFESINCAKSKFLSFFDKSPEQIYPNKSI